MTNIKGKTKSNQIVPMLNNNTNNNNNNGADDENIHLDDKLDLTVFKPAKKRKLFDINVNIDDIMIDENNNNRNGNDNNISKSANSQNTQTLNETKRIDIFGKHYNTTPTNSTQKKSSTSKDDSSFSWQTTVKKPHSFLTSPNKGGAVSVVSRDGTDVDDVDGSDSSGINTKKFNKPSPQGSDKNSNNNNRKKHNSTDVSTRIIDVQPATQSDSPQPEGDDVAESSARLSSEDDNDDDDASYSNNGYAARRGNAILLLPKAISH
eukprot:TRINITY_DN2226_c1_g1_i1.p1 TRINITY_DN2226_c1_g1~~TRINITY_DN2226_c1_g1_i1.p1  ORF type:complete len:264 (-),score=104.39 TRINITY_DN2226_c1_g1_i1:148-939(-)